MKLLNKKGFMLVETLIVTSFVMALFILVYKSVVPFMGEYEQMSTYDDVDSIYASNLWKEMVTKYANTSYIDEYLTTNTYLEINDCNNKNVYFNSNYCQKLKNNLAITELDNIFITKYDISEFRSEVEENDYFDSGNLSNFRNYIATVSNTESFYNGDNPNHVGKYRLFITRTVTESDDSTTHKFANIGIYTGIYQNYVMGQSIVFNTGDGSKVFYVLKNSPTTESKVTLILADNLTNSNVKFNDTNLAESGPNLILQKLKEGTDNWTNVDAYTTEEYVSLDNYTISYNGYRARLLNENDISEFLGCNGNNNCFNYKEAFAVNFNSDNLKFLVSNLNDNTGYWTGVTIPGSNAYAWSIQKGRVVPSLFSEESVQLGVRPVITVLKSKLN